MYMATNLIYYITLLSKNQRKGRKFKLICGKLSCKTVPINKKEPPTHIKSESVAFLLVVRNFVSEDFVVTCAVLVYSAAIA